MNYNFNFSKNIPYSENSLGIWDFSCPAVLNGEFYLFRKHAHTHLFNDEYDEFNDFYMHMLYKFKASIFKIVNCGFEEIGELPFDYLVGSCGTFLFPDERIFLCFGDRSRKKCHRWCLNFFLLSFEHWKIVTMVQYFKITLIQPWSITPFTTEDLEI